MDFNQPPTPTDPSTSGSRERLHWEKLQKFFSDNELAIAKAEEAAKADPAKLSDHSTTFDLFESTVNVVLNGLNVLAHVHPVLGSELLTNFLCVVPVLRFVSCNPGVRCNCALRNGPT